MTRRSTSSIVAVVAAAAIAMSGLIGLTGRGVVPASAGTAPPDPADFDDPQPNPYFPLEPGWKATLRGSEGGDRWIEHVVVTERTKEIQGITTTVVRDVITSHGVPVERTFDWYAADDGGTVWYFGEDTVEFDEHGDPVSTHGSWEAGVDGAVAGIIMPAHPKPTDAYRQEFYRGEAEDQGWVTQRGVTIRVPYGRVDHAVRTFEWSRLEPKVIGGKIYGRDLGIVLEYTVAGGTERLKLVRVHEPS